jgi:acyl carrier protein
VVSSFTLAGSPEWWPDISPVGRPVANTWIYLLDARLEPVAIGVSGELYAGGACLPRGYLGSPAQTAQKLVPDPWSGRPGERLYRTGDLARYLADGRIEYFGRIDSQVKIRGFRVELGEVETVVKQHLEVRDAAVLAHPGPGGAPRLVAYVVTRNGHELTAELRAFLKQKLPEHMVPAVFVPMRSLPLNANGKLDREALPVPGAAAGDAEFVAPSGPVEEVLAQIWERTLGLPRVGARDNFFDLGGHSLLITQVATRVRRNFAVELPLRAFFDAPTVAELARAVTARENRPGQSERIARALLSVRGLSAAELQDQIRMRKGGRA